MIVIAGNPGFPSGHCQFAWIVFSLQCFRCTYFIDYILNHFSAVVLMRCHYIRKNTYKSERAVRIAAPAYRNQILSGNTAIHLQLPRCVKCELKLTPADWTVWIFIDDD